MDLAEIVRVMRRRWYVLIPGLLVSAALVVGVYVGVPTKYQSQSTVELLNSQKATVNFDGNPFLSTQTSLTGMADSLARNLNSDAAIADLKSQGLTGTYVAMIADNAQGPLMWLTVTGTDSAAVLNSDKLLTAYAAQRLQQFQAQQSVSPQAMIQMTTIVPPQNPVPQTKTKLEYLVIAALMGIAGSMVLAFYVEAKRRRKVPAPLAEELAPVAAGGTADDEDDADPVTAPEPAKAPAPRRLRSDEDLEQPTVQLSVLQLPDKGRRPGGVQAGAQQAGAQQTGAQQAAAQSGAQEEQEHRAPWFAP